MLQKKRRLNPDYVYKSDQKKSFISSISDTVQPVPDRLFSSLLYCDQYDYKGVVTFILCICIKERTENY